MEEAVADLRPGTGASATGVSHCLRAWTRRGAAPLAGPVAAAAVVLTPEEAGSDWLRLVDDSKALTPLQRQKALEHIETHAIAIGLGMATHQEIDSQGIGSATRTAMLRAIDDLRSRRDTIEEVVRPSHLLNRFRQAPRMRYSFSGDGPGGQPQLLHSRRIHRRQSGPRQAHGRG